MRIVLVLFFLLLGCQYLDFSPHPKRPTTRTPLSYTPPTVDQSGLPSPGITSLYSGAGLFDSTVLPSHDIVNAWADGTSSCACDRTVHDFVIGLSTMAEEQGMRDGETARCQAACPGLW